MRPNERIKLKKKQKKKLCKINSCEQSRVSLWPLWEVQTPLTRSAFSSLCLSTAWLKASRNRSRVIDGAYRQKKKHIKINHVSYVLCKFLKKKSLPLQKVHGQEMVASWGLFHSSLCFFWKRKEKQTKFEPAALWATAGSRCYDEQWWCDLGAMYSQGNAPQVQTVFGHLTLSKAHSFELIHGKQLLSGVDDLALQISRQQTAKNEAHWIVRVAPCTSSQWS